MTSAPDGDFLQAGYVASGGLHRLKVGRVSMPISSPCPTISPDGKWIAAVPIEDSTAIRLWPVPDLSQPPVHTLPYDELLTKLRTLTNLRVVADPDSDAGWSWDLDPFPGWEEVPVW